MWPFRSPNMNSYDFYLWDMLTDKVYGMKFRTEADLKETIRNTAFPTSPAERRRATTCLFFVTRVWVPNKTISSTYGELKSNINCKRFD
jgi:hypothetical protein